MNRIEIEKCKYCGSTNIGIGYMLGNGQLYADRYAYHSKSSSSEIETYLCKDCGSILYSKVLRTDLFENVGEVRNLELLDYFSTNGFLLMNEHPSLPSVCGLGYNPQNLVYLIEQRKVFYSKAFGKSSIYLSIKAYQFLKRIKKRKVLLPEAEEILKEMRKFECVDKSELKKKMNIDPKVFNKAFDQLLENLHITAYSGKKINAGWYAYMYCTAEQFEEKIEGLHFNGNAEDALWNIVKQSMSMDEFKKLCN